MAHRKSLLAVIVMVSGASVFAQQPPRSPTRDRRGRHGAGARARRAAVGVPEPGRQGLRHRAPARHAEADDRRAGQRRPLADRPLPGTTEAALSGRAQGRDDRRRARLRLPATRWRGSWEPQPRADQPAWRRVHGLLAGLRGTGVDSGGLVGQVRVVALDYRQGPEHTHPAASEDVAAVLSRAAQVLSGRRTSASTAVPPAACSPACRWRGSSRTDCPGRVPWASSAPHDISPTGFGGDPSTHRPRPARRAIRHRRPRRSPAHPRVALPYFAGASTRDPLVAPASSPEVLAKFPPTLLITGTRSFDLSSTVHTHALLVKAGVDADLHVWDGVFHGFFYNVDVPESRDAFDVVVRFFDRHLGK